MMKITRFMLFSLLLLSGNSLFAEDAPVEFKNPVLKERYYALIEEVRCLVCQNQSLADSNADLAQDLRNEIYQKIVEGKDNEQIVTFLVERYGDFVLYRPPLKENTWLLWFGPFLILLITLITAVVLIKKQSKEKISGTELSPADEDRLKEILNAEANKDEQS